VSGARRGAEAEDSWRLQPTCFGVASNVGSVSILDLTPVTRRSRASAASDTLSEKQETDMSMDERLLKIIGSKSKRWTVAAVAKALAREMEPEIKVVLKDLVEKGHLKCNQTRNYPMTFLMSVEQPI
jgi:hypothetical protein